MIKYTQLILASTFLFTVSLLAKIADPSPVIYQGISYQSHLNYVQAIKVKNGKVLWKTNVYPESEVQPKNVDTKLELDVQLNVISSIAIKDDLLEVKDKLGRIFYLNLKTGKIVNSN